MLILRKYVHTFANIEAAPFDVAAYSRMKHGCMVATRRFAREMADMLWADAQACEFLSAATCVVVPPPSAIVPVAGLLLAMRLREEISDRLVRAGHAPLQYSRIERDVHYNFDYAEMAAPERRALLTGHGRYMTRDYLRGKRVLFVDDVRITGTHEEKIELLLQQQKMDTEVDYGFCAYARYMGTDATIEHQLNRSHIRTASQLLELTSCTEWTCTTRAVRLLLDEKPEALAELLRSAPLRVVRAAYHAAIVKGYHAHAAFAMSFGVLRAQYDAMASGAD